jgi:hypothetical protein
MWSDLVCLCCLLVAVQSHSDGPPLDVEGLCADMIPHHGHDPARSPPPYEISLSQQCYKEGQKLKVTIKSKSDGGTKHSIYGLFVQARPTDATEMAYGRFTTSNDHLQTLKCFNKTNSAIGHKESKDHDHKDEHDGNHEHYHEHHDNHDHTPDDDGDHDHDDGHDHTEGEDHEDHNNEEHDHDNHEDENHDHAHEGHDHDDHDHNHDGHDHHDHHGAHMTYYERWFEWTAENDYNQDLTFMATIVEHKTTYWVHVHSPTLKYDANCLEAPYEVSNPAPEASSGSDSDSGSAATHSHHTSLVISSLILAIISIYKGMTS